MPETTDPPPGLPILGVPKTTARAICGLTPRQFNSAVKTGRLPPPLQDTQTWLVDALRRGMTKWGGLETEDGDWSL